MKMKIPLLVIVALTVGCKEKQLICIETETRVIVDRDGNKILGFNVHNNSKVIPCEKSLK